MSSSKETSTEQKYSQERQDVWYTLSELFLDTQLMPEDYDRIANKLASTKYNESELDDIMRNEVAPILSPNLTVVGGQWGCFNREEDVIKPIMARLKALSESSVRGLKVFKDVNNFFQMLEVKDEWQAMLAKVATLRGLA